MSKSTISTFELFQMFPDQESARTYLEAQRWPDGAICPACVEAVDVHGERRRFIVGKSTGWRPCHLEIKTARSACGDPARARYQSVKALEKIR